MRDSRKAAFDALYNIIYKNAYSNIEIDKAISNLTEGKAFAARLAYGVIERQITLDYLIGKFCSKAKPKVRIILLMGAYQLYFMDKVPASAAIDESVNLAKNAGLAYYSKLINAVLHKIDEQRVDINSIEDASIKYSVPANLINMWNKQYGQDVTQSVLNCVNERPPVFAVPNYTKTDLSKLIDTLSGEGVDCEAFCDLVRINSSFDLNALKSYNDGLFHIQDLSCFKAVNALGVTENSVVLDICAAPGGKSFTAASLCGDKCKIHAFDIHSHRVDLINNGAKRLGLNSVNAQINDATVYNPDMPKADYIICDVPCSGFGIIRRKPEIRYKELDSVKELPTLQYTILSCSALYLKNGGRLMYSTCTLNKKENEQVIKRFLDENNEYILIEENTFFPDNEGGDGFYYSIIERL